MYSLIMFNGQGLLLGNRIPWTENILPRDTVEKYLIGLIFLQHKTTQLRSVWTENYRNKSV